MNRRDQFVTFTTFDEMEIEHDAPVKVNLTDRLLTHPDLVKIMPSQLYFIPKVIKVIIKPLAPKKDPEVVDESVLRGDNFASAPWVYGMCFSKEPIVKIEEMKERKLKYFKKSDEDIIFVFDIQGKKSTIEGGVTEIPDLYIGSYFHNMNVILRLEYALLLA